MNKIHTMGEYAPVHQNDRRFVGVEDVVHYQTIMPLRHLSFDTISSIQFCVDGAHGLPTSVTATRVTARLLSHDRTQIGEPSAPSYSNPDSDARNPKFDLHMGWRGKSKSLFKSFLLILTAASFLFHFHAQATFSSRPSQLCVE